MSVRRPLRRTRSFGDADAVFDLSCVAPEPAPAPAPAPAAPAPIRAPILRARAPAPLRAPAAPGRALALAALAAQVPVAPPPSMHHINISSFIPFKLSLDANNCSKWRQLFAFVLTKYQVEDHVEEAVDPLHADAVWRNDDITIVLWIYATISDELYDVVQSPNNTAYHLWRELEVFFRDNAAGRTVHIGAEFRATVQGDLSIAQYCRRLKQLSDAMADVGEPVTDRSLTLQLVRGLSRRFHVMATLLPMQVPFPTFNQARSRLLLEEISLGERERTEGAGALSIGHGGGSSSGNSERGGDRGERQPPPSPTDKGKGAATPPSGDRQRGGRGRGRGSNTSSPAPLGRGQQPWLGYFAPWGSPAPSPQQWRAPWMPPNSAGVLGPRPELRTKPTPSACRPRRPRLHGTSSRP
ncbi:uncharacterized protein [Aegilops tauschii subsp. strangulata]|uniref:Uncharacterized protein n=1 Tax=Aegilops tauschii subsp. strangulata TaxID=200361 RepID=A0A453EQ71_AEGTS|nr:uncharacterized protein LOC123497840 [Aegilops tauschii subsp. strangulata]